MRVTPNSTARRRTRRASAGSAGSPHAPSPPGAWCRNQDGERAYRPDEKGAGGDAEGIFSSMMDSILSFAQRGGAIPDEAPGTATLPSAYPEDKSKENRPWPAFHIPIRKQSLSAIRNGAPRRGRRHSAGTVSGTFGVHHFYLRRTGLGVVYCLFCWTGITTILGFIECFFMPGRVREFNAIQAAGIAAALGIPIPGWGQPLNVTVNVPATPQWPR